MEPKRLYSSGVQLSSKSRCLASARYEFNSCYKAHTHTLYSVNLYTLQHMANFLAAYFCLVVFINVPAISRTFKQQDIYPEYSDFLILP